MLDDKYMGVSNVDIEVLKVVYDAFDKKESVTRKMVMDVTGVSRSTLDYRQKKFKDNWKKADTDKK